MGEACPKETSGDGRALHASWRLAAPWRGDDETPSQWEQTWRYFFLPALVCVVLVWGYFSGIGWLSELIAPAWNREFGLLENLQNLLLLAGAWVALRSLLRGGSPLERTFMALFLAGSLFMFLEEIDYGAHFRELFGGLAPGRAPGFRNLHNLGNNSTRMKQAGDVVITLWFVLFPLVFRNTRNAVLRYFRPSCWFIPTAALSVAVSRVAHWVGSGGANGLAHSYSEFRELVTYYMGFLYVLALSRRRLASAADLAQEAQSRSS